jgi:hypothetical protein
LKQFAASSWLEYSYAWKPLVADVFDQAKNLSEFLTERSYVVRQARGSAKLRKTYLENIPTGYPVWINRKKVEIINKVSYVVEYRIRDGGGSVGNVFGLENPLLIAWELVPFSFVADWFLPLGDFLQSLTAYQGLEFHRGSKTSHRRINISCTTSPGPGVHSSVENSSGVGLGFGSNVGEYKTRILLTEFPRQTLPTFKDPRSFAHAASAISLIQSVFSGSRKGTSYYR